MRKVTALVLAIIMMFTLVACATKENETKEEPKPEHAHRYARYVCSGCEKNDSVHFLEYLIKWLKVNGKQVDGKFVCSLATTENSLNNLAMIYDTSIDTVYICSVAKINNKTHFLQIMLDDYSFQFSVDEDSIIGIVEASRYTKNAGEVVVLKSECVNLKADACTVLAKAEICILLDGLNEFLSDKNWEMTLKDIGFDSYECEVPQP